MFTVDVKQQYNNNSVCHAPHKLCGMLSKIQTMEKSYLISQMYNSFSNKFVIILYLLCYNRVATVREKYLENEIFPGQGKVREFCKWSGKFRKDIESQGKVREFEMAMSGRLRKFIYSVQRGEKMYCLRR